MRQSRQRRHWLRILVSLAATMLLGAAAASAGVDGHEIADEDIVRAIEGDIRFAKAVKLDPLDIASHEGVVTLNGTVDTLLAKDRAVRIAEMTKGVRSVVDQITVRRSDRIDGDIRKDVEKALAEDPATDSWEIDASVTNGSVRLDGRVQSFAEKELATKVAKGVKGVREIDNQIEIDFGATRTDPEIRAEIEQRLRWDVRIYDGLIDVSVEDGAVTLSGAVGSAFERRLATGDAWVAGVKSVDANVDIQWWAKDEMKRLEEEMRVTDDQIRRAVRDALLYDPRVASFNVDVTVEHRRVTLQGIVSDAKAKRAAAQDARNTFGVWQVTNHLKVRPEIPLSDEIIERRVHSALLRDPVADRHEIEVSAHGGDVYLYGTVDTYYERTQSEDVAARVPGVVAVHNYLTVRNRVPRIAELWFDDWDPVLYDFSFDTETVGVRPDSQIRREIESEFVWSPFVDADAVTVAVEDGEATLTGTVDSWRERTAATENALEGGAIMVRNRLVVR